MWLKLISCEWTPIFFHCDRLKQFNTMEFIKRTNSCFMIKCEWRMVWVIFFRFTRHFDISDDTVRIRRNCVSSMSWISSVFQLLLWWWRRTSFVRSFTLLPSFFMFYLHSFFFFCLHHVSSFINGDILVYMDIEHPHDF